MSTESYVVRIYRRTRDDPHAVLGVLEAVDSEWQQPFSTIEQLLQLLVRAAQPPAEPLTDDG